MKRKKYCKPTHLMDKKDIVYYQNNFKDICEKCGEPLTVIKHRPKSHNHREVVAATCINTNFKGHGFKCELYLIEIRFIEKFI